MNSPDYNREMESAIAALPEGERPRLLLHACCAPCSSACLERLTGAFRVTAFYYNPNISPEAEYVKRAAELMRIWPDSVVADYDPAAFREIGRGLEREPEGGARCAKCYELRLGETARRAREEGYDYFCTALSVSPYKDAGKLNAIGRALEAETGVKWLASDFKKKGGYARSVALSRELGLYRQDYCGCVFSKAEREKRKREEREHGR